MNYFQVQWSIYILNWSASYKSLCVCVCVCVCVCMRVWSRILLASCSFVLLWSSYGPLPYFRTLKYFLFWRSFQRLISLRASLLLWEATFPSSCFLNPHFLHCFIQQRWGPSYEIMDVYCWLPKFTEDLSFCCCSHPKSPHGIPFLLFGIPTSLLRVPQTTTVEQESPRNCFLLSWVGTCHVFISKAALNVVMRFHGALNGLLHSRHKMS